MNALKSFLIVLLIFGGGGLLATLLAWADWAGQERVHPTQVGMVEVVFGTWRARCLCENGYTSDAQ